MGCYKFFTHLLKPYFWYTTSELSEANDVKFYERFLETGYTVDSAKDKVFQLYHLNGAHSSYNMDEYGKKGKSTLEQ